MFVLVSWGYDCSVVLCFDVYYVLCCCWLLCVVCCVLLCGVQALLVCCFGVFVFARVVLIYADWICCFLCCWCDAVVLRLI